MIELYDATLRDGMGGAGTAGEVTRAVQGAFEDALYGRTERYREWLDPVPAFKAQRVA